MPTVLVKEFFRNFSGKIPGILLFRKSYNPTRNETSKERNVHCVRGTKRLGNEKSVNPEQLGTQLLPVYMPWAGEGEVVVYVWLF